MKAGLTPISDSLGLSYGDLIPVKYEDQNDGDGQSTLSGRSERTISLKSNAASLSEGKRTLPFRSLFRGCIECQCSLPANLSFIQKVCIGLIGVR